MRDMRRSYPTLSTVTQGDAVGLLTVGSAANPSGAPCVSSTPITSTITGANFYAVRDVSLDGSQNLVFSVQSISQMSASIPLSVGSHVIKVDAFGGSSVPAGPVFVVYPPLSASVAGRLSSTGSSTDTGTVTSCGAPVGGATVSVNGQPTFTTVTNTSGVALVSHLPCYGPGLVPKVGQTALPSGLRQQVACGGLVSMTGYQSTPISLP